MKQQLDTYSLDLGISDGVQEEHPDTLRSMHALAIRYSEVGRRQEALQLMEQVVEANKRTLGVR